MDESRGGILGEIATEASIERASFLSDAGKQFTQFMEANRERIKELGGMVLIDEDPDYLSVAEDGSFRSRSRYQDETTGEWISDTEIIESAAELVELYNPAEIYAVFAEAARDEAGLPEQPTAAEDLLETAGMSQTAGMSIDDDDEADDDEGTGGSIGQPKDKEDAARIVYDLALTFQERSQNSEARLLERFQATSKRLASMLGDAMILDDEDERLWYKASGSFEAEVVPESTGDGDGESEDEPAEPTWRALTTPEDMVQFYDPTDLFGDLAEALAEQHPGVAPELGASDDPDAADHPDAADDE